jgi:hypothetical protein
MPFILNQQHVEQLCQYVDARIRLQGCNHSHRFAEDWAKTEGIDWDDLLDILEGHGAFCDCEVVLNLPGEADLAAPPDKIAPVKRNPWLLPPGFRATGAEAFTKTIVCQEKLTKNTHASEGEVLVPPPFGAKPRKRVRKSMHFFVGCASGMPAEIGIVKECAEISALQFAKEVADSGIKELADFTFREAAFVLSRAALVKPAMPVATHFSDRIGVASRHWELTIHRIIFK